MIEATQKKTALLEMLEELSKEVRDIPVAVRLMESSADEKIEEALKKGEDHLAIGDKLYAPIFEWYNTLAKQLTNDLRNKVNKAEK